MVSVQLLLCALVEEAVQISRKAYGNMADDNKVPRPLGSTIFDRMGLQHKDQKAIAFTSLIEDPLIKWEA
jgi:hypothetical protein